MALPEVPRTCSPPSGVHASTRPLRLAGTGLAHAHGTVPPMSDPARNPAPRHVRSARIAAGTLLPLAGIAALPLPAPFSIPPVQPA